MTEPKRPKVSGSIVVSEFKRGAEAVRDVILPMLLNRFHQHLRSDGQRLLRLFAQHLIDNPDLIPPSPWKPVILEILRQFVIDHPLRKLDNAAIADAVDLLLLKTRTIANQDDPVLVSGNWRRLATQSPRPWERTVAPSQKPTSATASTEPLNAKVVLSGQTTDHLSRARVEKCVY